MGAAYVRSIIIWLVALQILFCASFAAADPCCYQIFHPEQSSPVTPDRLGNEIMAGLFSPVPTKNSIRGFHHFVNAPHNALLRDFPT